jgi:HAD superfamily hydrolase (TIGR01549 family)
LFTLKDYTKNLLNSALIIEKMTEKKTTKTVKKAHKKKIKAIIFDLWGTILENGVYPSPTKQTKKILGLFDMAYPEFVIRFEKAFMTTRYDNIKEGLQRVFEEFNVNPNEYNRVDRLVGLWNKAKIMSKLYPETISTLENLKKNYKIILLSNLPSTQNDIIDRFEFKKYFDEIALSYELGCIKSEGGFKKIMENTGFSPDEIVMVGDSIDSDIESAKKEGIMGILIDRRDVREYDLKIKELGEIQKIIDEVK